MEGDAGMASNMDTDPESGNLHWFVIFDWWARHAYQIPYSIFPLRDGGDHPALGSRIFGPYSSRDDAGAAAVFLIRTQPEKLDAALERQAAEMASLLLAHTGGPTLN